MRATFVLRATPSHPYDTPAACQPQAEHAGPAPGRASWACSNQGRTARDVPLCRRRGRLLHRDVWVDLGRVLLCGRHELPKLGQHRVPVREHGLSLGGARPRGMRLDELLELRSAGVRDHALVGHDLGVDLVDEVAVLVEEVAQAARHARSNVAPDRAQAHDRAAGHVLAAVIASALHDRLGERIAHSKALAGAAVYKQAAARRAVEACVADDRRRLGLEAGIRWRLDRDDAACHALAHVIVGLADKRDVHAMDHKAAKRLACGAQKVELQMALEAEVTVVARNLATNATHRRAVDVDDVVRLLDRAVVLDRCLHVGVGEDLVVELGPVVVHRRRDARGRLASGAGIRG
mmetsp:Transcript_5873/g.17999  ORF Transcript_5873/g.17999 Transcript_5873/m.17999 type:complete len:349 (-) Transcript_5873:4268-5314(-)|eukprot:353460-Chlamydomonas_euryale.AAC.21